jgi:hypothetical protein
MMGRSVTFWHGRSIRIFRRRKTRYGTPKRRAGLDYHVDVEGHYYSVPHQLAKKVFDAA